MSITFADFRSGSRRRTRTPVHLTAAQYALQWGWAVAPAARLVRGDACSCGDPSCPEPGAHPLAGAGTLEPGSSVDEARALWQRWPGASAMLPVGRSFDAIEVPQQAGGLAMVRLERMGIRLGPVLGTPHGRALFLVAPGAAAGLPALLYRMGWDDAALDLRGLGAGAHITAPPCDLGGLGPVRWLRPPTAGTAEPPEARLLLGTLAYACHRTGSPGSLRSWAARH